MGSEELFCSCGHVPSVGHPSWLGLAVPASPFRPPVPGLSGPASRWAARSGLPPPPRAVPVSTHFAEPAFWALRQDLTSARQAPGVLQGTVRLGLRRAV